MMWGISTSFLWKTGMGIIDSLPFFRHSGIDLLEVAAVDVNGFNHYSDGFMGSFCRGLEVNSLKVHSIHGPIDQSISEPSPELRNNNVDYIINLMERVSPLKKFSLYDKPYFILHPGHHLSRTPAYDQKPALIDSLRKILKSGPASQYRICIENMLSSHYCGRADELVEIVEIIRRDFGEDSIYICLDTCHTVYDSTPCDFLQVIKPYVGSTHLSDNYHQSKGEFHALPLTIIHSRIDWPRLIRELSEKLDALILEPSIPSWKDTDLFLESARISMRQLERFVNQ